MDCGIEKYPEWDYDEYKQEVDFSFSEVRSQKYTNVIGLLTLAVTVIGLLMRSR